MGKEEDWNIEIGIVEEEEELKEEMKTVVI